MGPNTHTMERSTGGSTGTWSRAVAAISGGELGNERISLAVLPSFSVIAVPFNEIK